MSEQDRQLWNQRYRDGSYSARTYASPFLVHWLDRFKFSEESRALDLGCGAGRNSLYLARTGLEVHGFDISTVALAQAEQSAREQESVINFQSADLDIHSFEPEAWDLVVMIRYMNRALHDRLPPLLKPNGLLLVEHHVVTEQQVGGPQPPDHDSFRLRSNEILNACRDLHIISYQERLTEDRDGQRVALAQLAASSERCLLAN